MDYDIVKCGSAEVAPRSPHHAAMLLLEQRAAQLSKSIDALSETLGPALRPPEPQPSSGDTMAKNPRSGVQIIAHVDDVISVVDSCIQRVESLAGRLVI